MTKHVQTDNHNLKTKLDLRRHFLRKYHAGKSPKVFDCCQGQGVIWKELRLDLPVASYWGVDQKPKKGRVKIDSVRVLDQPGWTFDVIDVDTYGSPWEHWQAILKHAQNSLTVFLTIGLIKMGGGGGLSGTQKKALGLGKIDLPVGISGKLHDLSALALLAASSLGPLSVESISRNPPVVWEFEHALAVGELTGTRHLWKKNWGEFLGVLPVSPDTPVDRTRWLHIFKDTCPYQIRFMQRRRLKELLGPELRKFVGLAMRMNKGRFINEVIHNIFPPPPPEYANEYKPPKPHVSPDLLAKFLRKIKLKLDMDAGMFWRVAKGRVIISLPKPDVQGEMFLDQH